MFFLFQFMNPQTDPLEELYRKPDPTLADGQNLTQMFGRFPPELLGKQIEDIDYYYRSKKVSENSHRIWSTVIEMDPTDAYLWICLKCVPHSWIYVFKISWEES